MCKHARSKKLSPKTGVLVDGSGSWRFSARVWEWTCCLWMAGVVFLPTRGFGSDICTVGIELDDFDFG
jgi:hypothetical protein